MHNHTTASHFKPVLLLAFLLLSSMAFSQGRVLFMGDSITDGGWGRSGGEGLSSEKRNHWDMNHIHGHSYMMLCASYLESTFPEKGYACFNRGISGDDISRIKARWQKDALDLHPDVLSILEGINDIHYFLNAASKAGSEPQVSDFDMDSWENQLRELIQRSQEENPGLRVLLCTPFTDKVGSTGSSKDYPVGKALVDEMASRIRRLSGEMGLQLVDFNNLFNELKRDHPTLRNDYWIWDGIHPTPAAHHRMAQLWLKVFLGEGFPGTLQP